MVKDWTMTPVVSGTVSVDGFFLLSGCLTSSIFASVQESWQCYLQNYGSLLRAPILELTVVLGSLIAAGAGLTPVCVQLDNVHNMYKTGQTAWGDSEFAANESVSRPAWACAVAWAVFACCTGYGGFVNTFLSWRGWGPLSRLTYGVYLFHLTILYVILCNKIAPFYLSGWTVLTISVTVLTYMMSFGFSLLAESPTLGLEKVLLGGAGKRQK